MSYFIGYTVAAIYLDRLRDDGTFWTNALMGKFLDEQLGPSNVYKTYQVAEGEPEIFRLRKFLKGGGGTFM